MSSELLATYAGLGTYDGTQYYRGEECLACVKDLIRALREDDSQCEIRRHLGQAEILKKDLLHILTESSDDLALRNDVIRLLVNLTQPAYLCFGNTYPERKETSLMKCFMEVNFYLRIYKEAFTAEAVMNILGSVLADLCQKEWEEREDEDVIVIERILLLIRNLLHVSPDPQEEKRTEDDVSIHDQIIWNLHINGIDELLLFLGSNPAESQWCMHVLEIFFLLLKEQAPATLANTGRGKSQQEKKREEDLIDEVLAREKARKLKAQKIRGMRHSHFGGTFVVKNQKSISDRERVYHKPLTEFKNHSYDTEKRPRRKNKLRRPVSDLPKERASTYSIRLVLKNLCVQFLECCYNPLMKVVKDNIVRQRAMENDETYYLWCLRFFMEFSRIHDFRVDIVGETLHLPTLHYVITLTANYYESMMVEKRSLASARQWGQRLHYTVQAYKEILLYIQRMSLSCDETLKESAKVIMSNVFYHAEYREVFVTLLRNFTEVFQTKSSLRDMVEAAHVYVRMMERYCQENKHVVVQQRRKGGGGKGKKKKRKKGSGKPLTEDQLIDLWETIDARVGELLEGVEPLPIVRSPFDASSQLSMDEQKLGAMGTIRMFLIEARHPEAVSLLRASREVWPGTDFGSPGISIDEEMDIMRDILLNPNAALPVSHLLLGEDGDEGDSEEEGGAGGGASTTVELEFDLKNYLQRFSNNKIVRVYTLVLADYSTNEEAINHAVLKMLYRIAVQLKMSPLLYQISIFRTFMAILNEPPTSRLKELQKFSKYIVGGFFHMANKNPLMFVELLFWKTSRDCYELEMGYGTMERERQQLRMSSVWTREQEEELAVLYEKYKEEDDVVGCLEAALEDSEVKRSRKQITSQLVKQCLVMDRKELHRKLQKKRKEEWNDDELERLKEVYAEVQESCDPKETLKMVARHFPDRGIREVTQQLREVGLIQKRGVTTGTKKSGAQDNGKKKFLSASIVESSEDSSEDSEPVLPNKESRGGRGLDGSVGECVKRLYSLKYMEELQWLEAYLTDEARDRTIDDEWEEMCVVAVSNRVAKALETSEFQQLLGALGLQPPSQQDSYWRIPSTMSPSDLIAAAHALRPTAPMQEWFPNIDQSRGNHMTHFSGGNKSHEDHTTHVSDDDQSLENHMTHLSDDDQSHENHMTHLSDDEYSDAKSRKVTRLKALNQLLKQKGKAPLKINSAPLPSKTKSAPLPKRPRLALQSEFLESDSDSSPELELNQMNSKNVTTRRKWGRRRHIIGVDSSEDEKSSSEEEEVESTTRDGEKEVMEEENFNDGEDQDTKMTEASSGNESQDTKMEKASSGSEGQDSEMVGNSSCDKDQDTEEQGSRGEEEGSTDDSEDEARLIIDLHHQS